MDLELSRLFVKVVQQGSFTKAADVLKLPKSTVSKAIRKLEEESGTQLLVRTTRSLTMTAAGRGFFEACIGPIQSLEDARKSLSGKDSVMAGIIRITAPEDLGGYVIAPAIAELSQKHQALDFELNYTDTIVDLVKDGFDFAVRIGRLAESGFKARKLGEVRLIVVASPAYLKGKPKITKPKDLESHSALSFSESSLMTRWPLKSKGESQTANVNARIASNQMTSLMKMALAGGGITLIPSYLAEADLRAGTLVRVLPEWEAPGMAVHLISPRATAGSVRLKLTADFLAERLQQLLQPSSGSKLSRHAPGF